MKLFYYIIAGVLIISSSSSGQDVKWQKYSSKEFGYTIKYPTGWKITEAKPRKDNKAAYGGEILLPGELQKVSFADTSDRYWQAQLQIRIIEIHKGKTFDQWVKEYEYSDTTDFNPVEQVKDTVVSGRPAKKATLFNFDHTGQELILKNKHGVMLISYEGQNPNDKRNEWHRGIFRKMIESFKTEK